MKKDYVRPRLAVLAVAPSAICRYSNMVGNSTDGIPVMGMDNAPNSNANYWDL